MIQPLIQIKDLSVDFGTGEKKTQAVKNISFSIKRGQVVALVGESGSGKTVTSLSILKLLPPFPTQTTKGDILFSPNSKDLINISLTNEKDIRKIRGKDIAMIFQEPMSSLNPLMTCGAQVIEAIRIHHDITIEKAREKTISIFKKVNLPDPKNIIKKFPHQLSGGQKQRVMIAMAMSCEPSLLIADEPTTALDVTVQKTILKLIKDLQKENGMGVLYISHDLNLVAEIADKILVMLKGEIVEEGDVLTILNNPKHPYTKALLACRPNDHNKGKRLPVIKDFMFERNEIVESTEKHFIDQEKEKKDTNILAEVSNLVVTFPLKRNLFGNVIQKFTAVDHISFSIFNGETLGIVGESGCGKTTLGQTLIRLTEPSSGKIIFNGKNITELGDKDLRNLRRDIQIIFQDPFGSLNPRLTIGSAIEEPLKVHHLVEDPDERRESVFALLKKVDLKPEYFDRYPHQFSGGQRQRICIARALALNPDFIICDESVSALDVSVQAQVLNLLNDLKKELGFTCVFISHDLGVVRYISDRILVMKKGKIVELGDAEQIYFSPKEEYTRALINSIPRGLRN